MRTEMNVERKNGDTAVTQDVLTHHLDCFGNGDLAGTMADYTDESRFFTPDGVLRTLLAWWTIEVAIHSTRRSTACSSSADGAVRSGVISVAMVTPVNPGPVVRSSRRW